MDNKENINEQNDRRSDLTPEAVANLKSKKKQATTQYKLYKYYFIIALTSLIAVFFLPMLAAPALGFTFPNTFSGWVIYVITKLIVAAINMLLFHCFMCQGKLNIKDNPFYLEAVAILKRWGIWKDGSDSPRGPEEWLHQEYRGKGVWVAITSVLSAVIITQAVLTFDWISMLTYLFTIIMGVIFGLFQQDTAETYWTEEFWYYAKNIEKYYLSLEQKEKINNKQGEINNDTN